jgi:hypothetical protein
MPKLSSDQNPHGFRCFGMILGDNAVTTVAMADSQMGVPSAKSLGATLRGFGKSLPRLKHPVPSWTDLR